MMRFLRLVHLFTQLGFGKFRLTGGEPTVRANISRSRSRNEQHTGVETMAMTTNGLMLDKLAQPLAEAGMQRVNISIDTLDPQKFNKLTRWGKVEDVLDGITMPRKKRAWGSS